MTPLPDDQTRHHGPTVGPDFEEALIQAMDDFANDAHTPAFDPAAILHRTRTRRRRGLAAVAASAAAVLLTAGAAFALHGSDRGAGQDGPAAPGVLTTAAPTTPSPVPDATPSGVPTGNGTPSSGATAVGSGTPSPGADSVPGPGSATVVVPPVLGMPEDLAEKTLTEAGLKIGHVQDFTDWNTPAGAVINTEPRSGVAVAPGAAVGLFVSKGKP